MTNEVKFPDETGASFVVRFEGDFIASDASRQLVLFLDPDDVMVIDEPAPGDLEADEQTGRRTVALPDDQSLQDYFDGSALQAILTTLNDLRTARKLGGGEGA